MKTLILSILFLSSFTHLDAFGFKSISADYEVSYGIFGQVGAAHATLDVQDGTYKIRIEAVGKGVAKFFSRDRKEVYESTGIVNENRLLPNLFIKDKSWGEKLERKRYFFNHETKQVTVVQTSVDEGKVLEESDLLPYYAENDILTIFFNLPALIGKAYVLEKQKDFHAVGAKKEDGKITIKSPQGKEKSLLTTLLENDSHLLMVTLNQKLFASKNGELFINISDEGICDSVVLKDVIMYGDLRGKIKNLKIEKAK